MMYWTGRAQAATYPRVRRRSLRRVRHWSPRTLWEDELQERLRVAAIVARQLD